MVVTYNLALAYSPRLFSGGDYQAIAHEIRKLTSEIDIYIIADQAMVRAPAALAQLPLMTFCPSILKHFKPPRGKVFCGQKIPKDEQLRLLAKGGVRVPKWTYLKPGLRLSENEWGPHVVVKPVAFGVASKGRGVELARTSKLAYSPTALQPKRGPAAFGELIVQKLVESGDYSEDYRVVTLFGRPLYALRRKSLVKLVRPGEHGPSRTAEGVVSNASSGPRETGLCYEQDILDFAASCYRAVPSVPFQAVDVRRDITEGRLYCLEINPGGHTWNFSSPRAAAIPTIDGIRREDQFGAWKIAAEALVENTRLFAA